MNIIIIEDEVQTAWDLKQSIERLPPDFIILAVLDSVESGLDWFSEHEQPDLIFSDIQLGDGMAFDIFNKITLTCPVIFCTAYDEYAILAFRNNGIDYLLKPVDEILGSNHTALDARFPLLTHVLIGNHLPLSAFLRL